MWRLRITIIASLILFCAVSSAQYQTGERSIPCKTEMNAKMCFWTHGRLGFGNGTPALRLWKIGTTRVFGIYSGPSRYNAKAKDPDEGDNEAPQLPLEVIRAMWHNQHQQLPRRIFADFEVCPLEAEKPGTMQAACVESAKNIVVEKLVDP